MYKSTLLTEHLLWKYESLIPNLHVLLQYFLCVRHLCVLRAAVGLHVLLDLLCLRTLLLCLLRSALLLPVLCGLVRVRVDRGWRASLARSGGWCYQVHYPIL